MLAADDPYSPFRPIEVIDGFPVVKRVYSEDPKGLSIGLANISAVVPDIEANKDKILRAARIFRDCRVNFAIFPEMCLSGYFWEDQPACRRYMREALIERHVEWLERELKPLLDDEFIGIILNGLTAGEGDRFRNRTFIVANDHEYLAPENSYDK